MHELLFSYGTLQQKATQLRLFGRVVKGERDALPDYAIETILITDPAFIATGEKSIQKTLVPLPGNPLPVQGTVLLLTLPELEITDRYEPDNYSRIKVKLSSGKQAWIYLAIPVKSPA